MSIFPTEVQMTQRQKVITLPHVYSYPINTCFMCNVERALCWDPGNWTPIPFLPQQGIRPWASHFPHLDHSLLICEMKAWAGRFIRSLSALWVSVCVWLNGGRTVASELNATTLFPNAGWLHWSALRLGMAGPLPFQRGLCQNPSHLPWDIWGQYFPIFSVAAEFSSK